MDESSVPTKSTAELRVLCYPAEAIAKGGGDVGVCDTVLNLMFRAAHEIADLELDKAFSKQTGTEFKPHWHQPGTISKIGPNIDFILFSHGKAIRGPAARTFAFFGGLSNSAPLSGFYLKPKTETRNNVIAAAPKGVQIAKARAPKGGDCKTIRWRHRRGLAKRNYDARGFEFLVSCWITSIPDRLPRRTFVYHSQLRGDILTEIESIDEFPALQQHVWELIGLCESRQNNNKGGLRLMWGGRANSLELRRGAYPAICRAKPDATPGSDDEWEIVQRITGWGKFEIGGDLTVGIENIGGRLCVTMADGQGKGATWDFPAFKKVPGDPKRGVPDKFETAPWEWPAGPLGFSAVGVQAHLCVSPLDLSVERKVKVKKRDKKGRRVTVEETRRGPLRDTWERMPQTLSPGAPPPDKASLVVAGGYFPPGGSSTVKANVTVAGKITTIDYSCELVSNRVVSPLVSHVGGQHQSVPEVADFEALDVTSALVGKPHESGAALGSMASRELTFELDRVLLDQIASEKNGAIIGDDPSRPWTDYVAADNPIEFQARWRLTDGTYTPWSNRLQGYIVSDEPSSAGAFDWNLKIVARDKLHRLTDPAGMVDESDGPLDLLMFRSDGEPVYGTQMAAAIIANKLGPTEAARINGGGPDAATLFYEEDHPPMMLLARAGGGLSLQNGARMLGAPNKAGFDFSPPWGRDAVSWLKDLAGQDFSTFFYGHVVTDGGQQTQWPCLIWGDLSKILAGRPVHTVSDAIYEAGDADRLVMALRVTKKANKRINEAKVWASPPGETSQLPFPATKMATARLPASDPNSAERSWKRTQIIESQTLWPSGWAQETSSLIIRGLEGLDVKWPQLTIRGSGEIQEGDELTVKQLHLLSDSPDRSDIGLAVAGDRFRVLHTEQEWDMDRHNWITKLEVFPISLFERIEQEANNG